MSLSLVYDGTLSRVRMTATTLLGSVTMQRSPDQIRWTTLRGGTEVLDLAGTATLDDYEFNPDVVNFYRAAPFNPGSGLFLGGVVGSNATTPDTAALDITGDIDVRVLARPNDWTVASQVFAAKRNGVGQESWQFYVDPAGIIQFAWWDAAGVLINVSGSSITANTGVADGQQIGLRATLDVNDGAGNRVVKFWYATTLAGPWTQFGSTVTAAGVTSIRNSTAPVEIGSRDGGTTNLLVGFIRALEVRNGIDGTIVANPNFQFRTDGAASITDGTGKVWTVNGAARLYGFQNSSITPVLDGVWLKSIARPFLNRQVTVADFGDVERSARAGVFDVQGRSLPVAVSDVRGSRRWTLDVLTQTLAEASDVDLVLASGDPLFVHVPADSPVPGGYVTVGDTTQRRTGRTSLRRVFSLPCTEVAAPGPDVVGATVNWQAILNDFATWADVLAAFPTWADVLEYVASPQDVIVP